MPKSKAQKQETVERLVERFRRAKIAIFTGFSGLTVSEETQLRSKLREAGIDYHVAKKTLLRRAFETSKISGVPLESFTGGIGLTIGYGDEAAAGKLIASFAKEHPAVKFRGAWLDGQFLDAKAVTAFAALPSKAELYARLVGSIASPLRGVVSVLAGNLRGLLTVLQRASERPTS